MRYAPAKARLSAYKVFTVPKKTVGHRNITSPVAPLKAIQSALNILLQSIYVADEHATGFVPGRSVKDNALIHVGQTCIFNIDLADFFPSITKQMIRQALKSELADKLRGSNVVNYIYSICTVPDGKGKEVLPQGAPTSPVLSNIVFAGLDRDMAKLASRMECRYSRYADDITFSHNKPIRKISPFWQSKINAIVEQHGFTVNTAKTKTTTPGERQEVTGVVISSKINVSRKYIKQLRVLLHLWRKHGYDQAQAIYTLDFCGGVAKNLESVINGKINYLEMIKGSRDSTYLTLKKIFTRLRSH